MPCFLPTGGFESEYFKALPDEAQLAVRDAYWAHLHVVLQHGSRMDRTTEARM
jgi:hypothetical protein